MSKKAFDKIAAGLKDPIAIARRAPDRANYRVHLPADVDLGRIRRKLKLSQSEFAARFGIAPGTLRDWEQKRKRPEGPALLMGSSASPMPLNGPSAPARAAPPEVILSAHRRRLLGG
jgi:putative transcriptional regulator